MNPITSKHYSKIYLLLSLLLGVILLSFTLTSYKNYLTFEAISSPTSKNNFSLNKLHFFLKNDLKKSINYYTAPNNKQTKTPL